MNRLLIFLPLIFLILSQSNLWGVDKKFQRFTSEKGLSHNTVYDIEQDHNGFIWIATVEGLNRYDSYNFKVYYSEKNNHSIPSNEIRSLLVCSNGRLFVGTAGGLCIFNPDYDNFTTIKQDGQSLGAISDIFESADGNILVSAATGVFRLSADGEVKLRLPLEPQMNGLQEDSLKNFWAFKGQRLFNFDKDGKLLNTYFVKQNGLPDNIPSPISSILVDSKNRLWVGTYRDGALFLDSQTGKFRKIPLKVLVSDNHPMYYVRAIMEDKNGLFWIGTEKGLFIYNFETHNYEHYTQSFDPSKSSINDNAIYKIFSSRENIVWLGTYFGGLNYYEPISAGFKTIKPGINEGDLKGKAISQIMIGPDEKFWFATEDAGIAIADEQKRSFKHILNTPQPGNVKISSNVHALTYDKEGYVWSGNFMGGINRINPKNFEVQNYSHIPGNPKSLIHNFVFSLFNDSSDVLWVGTMTGIDRFDKKDKQFSRFKPEIFRGKFIYDIFQDRQKNYWFCTNNNHGLYRYNPEKDEVSHFVSDSIEGIFNNHFICHLIDSRGKIWFGTRGGGLVHFDPDSQKFTTYDMKNGLPNNVIYGILEDDHHNLWISSNKGISKFNYLSEEIWNFTADHGLVGNQFNYKSYFKAADGTMYFGAVNGLTYFNPDDVKTIESEPVIHFTNFKLFNEPVLSGEKSVLTKDIDQTNEIVLKYNQNVISFDFIALDFYSKGKNNFYYFMDGFESTWQPADKSQSATYTNLPPGQYYFRIKATNIYDYPNNKERRIKLIILPPIWQTYWAYLIYALLLSGIVYLLYRNNEIRYKEKMALKIEKIEKENLNKLHQHKINFFTYISHEFKTPLTIILATLDASFSDKSLPEALKTRIFTLKRNASRLQFLINQLMDFRKIETDHALPSLQSGNVIQFLHEVFSAFNTLFVQKDLEYIFIADRENLLLNFDFDKLEKILSNLLSNAFKYTPRYGEITLRVETIVEEHTSWLQITVFNSGNGISEEKIDKIFNLFYKIEDEQHEYTGSGVGLTLTQSLVKYLNGNISVESKADVGTTFVVKLPYKEEKKGVDIWDSISFNRDIVNNLMLQSSFEEDGDQTEKQPKEFDILLVEDNRELLKFLSQHFKEKYTISNARNGLEALESVKKHMPDLIITDLLMPQMDGIALCKALKSNFEYCHIPVIMLTSKSDVETRLESLEVGADYYLTKPFNLPELDLLIRNILSTKSNLKKHFIHFGNLNIDHPIKNREQQFIEKVTLLVQQNMNNPEFRVTTLTKELGIGRTLLHTKLKQILDMSASEFINTIHLKEAQKILIEHPELSMTEVAYKVGINDPNYFSRIFKKMFNVSPTAYRAQKTDGVQSPSDQTEICI
ncbi:MAG: two-component regulator propeller domain-containing protein [Mangrovibacterium sp.]